MSACPKCPSCHMPLANIEAQFCTSCGHRMQTQQDQQSASISDVATGAVTTAAQAAGASPSVESLLSQLLESVPSSEASSSADESVVSPQISDQQLLPIAVQWDAGQPFLSGAHGSLVFQVRSAQGCTLADVKISVTIAGSRLSDIIIAKVLPGTVQQAVVSWMPDHPGTMPVHLEVSAQEEGSDFQAWRGQSIVRVLDRDGQRNVHINIDQSVRAEGSSVISAKGSNVAGLEALGSIGKGINDHLEQSQQQWQNIALQSDTVLARQLLMATRHKVRVLFQPVGMPSDQARLANLNLNGAPVARLLAQPHLDIGRSGQTSQGVIRFLPRSSDNDAKTLRISGSRPHVRIALDAEGISVQDQDSANGTLLNGASLKEAQLLDLKKPSDLVLADVAHLRLTPLCDEDSEQTASRFEGLGVEEISWRRALQLGLRGLRVEHLDDDQKPIKQWLLVWTWITLGGISSDVSQQVASHNRVQVLFRDGSWWAMGQGCQPELAGQSVAQGYIVPWNHSQTLHTTDAQWTLDEMTLL